MVRHLGQPFQQARHLPGPDAGLLAELAHGVRQIVWGGLLLAVAAVAVVEAAAGLTLGVGGEDQRITVAPVEVAFERPWSWARRIPNDVSSETHRFWGRSIRLRAR
ncbi:hypothetical protein RKD37_001462 [Streptomyces ambofaciens]